MSSIAFQSQRVEELWTDPAVQNWLTLAVGNRVVYRMLNGN